MQEIRHLHLRGAVGAVRTETFEGVEYTVLPVVALVEGVVWAVNAASPEFVPASTLEQGYTAWNGRPCVLNHPSDGTQIVSANTPEILTALCFGKVFNAMGADGKLTMEAWLDPIKAAAVGPAAVDIIDRALAGKIVEVSVGVLLALEKTAGVFKNKTYSGIWRVITPDHLALLQDGETGACSAAMGCGIRAAHAHTITSEGMEIVEMAEPKTKTPTVRGLKQRMADVIRALGGNLTPDISDVDIRTELREALAAKEPGLSYVVAVYSDRVVFEVWEAGDYCLFQRSYNMVGEDATVADDRVAVEYVVSYVPVGATEAVIAAMQNEAETLRVAAGKTISETNMAKLQSIHDTVTGMGVQCITPAVTAASARPCGCGGSSVVAAASVKGENEMNREQRIAALMANEHNPFKDEAGLKATSDDGLTALEANATAVAAAKTEAATRAAAAAPPVVQQTEEQFLATAPQSVRDLVGRAKAQEATQKASLITGLKLATEGIYTEAELQAMTVDQLTRAAKLAKLDVEPVDFGVLAPRAAGAADTFNNPPDPYAPGLATMQGGNKTVN